MFPVPGPDQSDWCRDGVLSPFSSILSVSAQPEPDCCDGSHTGSPASICATTTAPEHQADKGTYALQPHLSSQLTDVTFWLFCNISSCWWIVLPGEGCVSFGTAVQPADSQSGWDRGDRKVSGAPCFPPSPVVSQSRRNPCSQWQWGPADNLRCVMERFKISKTKWFLGDKLFRGLCALPRSEVDSADAPRTPLCDKQWVVVPV